MTFLIDNQNGNTMERALKSTLEGGTLAHLAVGTPAHNFVVPDFLRIVSAYFSPSGILKLEKSLKSIEKVQILLGADGLGEGDDRDTTKTSTDKRTESRRSVTENISKLWDSILSDRDDLPFEIHAYTKLQRLLDLLDKGNISVRYLADEFLHAKAYIYTAPTANANDQGGVFVGSSNLTAGGLSSNLELNIFRDDVETVRKASQWYDDLWSRSVEVDLATFYKPVFALHSPWLVYLRVLHQLYGREMQKEETDHNSELELTSFQIHGVSRALRLLRENGGVLFADEVGLGKTFIAGAVLEIYRQRGQRTLLVCPASLRDSTWKNFLNEYKLYCECVSFHELANDAQVSDNSKQDIPSQPKDDYQLIIIDEAHNYRNPSTPARAHVLKKLLAGRRKDLMMLTATPVNNSLWDLHTLLDYFIRQDGRFVDLGILSMREKFKEATRHNPIDLHPDILYPVIDATTVKRTRQFVKKYYSDDRIKINNITHNIKFPEPNPITVRYELEGSSSDLMNSVFEVLDPDIGSLKFTRYKIGQYKIVCDVEDEPLGADVVIGLIRSGLLKRYESSVNALESTLERMKRQYITCIDSLKRGYVIESKFHSEFSGDAEAVLEEILIGSEYAHSSDQFDVAELQIDLSNDLTIIQRLLQLTKTVSSTSDSKLVALTAEISKIILEAEEQVLNESNNRKIIIFSYYADTVDWIYSWLESQATSNKILHSIKGRIAKISGGSAVAGDEEAQRDNIVVGFAPESMGKPQSANLYDVLVTTDVLAEGVNLQQCRHIINYDLPWNPMRLVQRHGRIDRIGSKHNRVFLRSFFPNKELNKLLNLEERIVNKIALAAATIGVQKPIKGTRSGHQIFSETREELERILNEDVAFYERGGIRSAVQSGEEYRQTLRKAITEKTMFRKLPWRAGTSMKKGSQNGIFFSAYIADTPQLCFVPADERWNLDAELGIEGRLGTCLRMIECESNTQVYSEFDAEDLIKVAIKFWSVARQHFFEEWDFKTDPKNLQPPVRKLNRNVIEFIERESKSQVSSKRLQEAINILESVWGRRDEALLRDKFNADSPSATIKAQQIVDWVVDISGLRPLEKAKPLPPIEYDDIKLLCWFAIHKEE